METCILLPRELSAVLRPLPGRVLEMGVTLWANRSLPPGAMLRPGSGRVRLDKFEVYSLLPHKDVRYQFGCYDDIIEVEDQEVRHCNWVRFVQSTNDMDEVNVVATHVDDEPVFQVVKTIPPNREINVFFDTDQLSSDDENTSQEQLLRHDEIQDKENVMISPASIKSMNESSLKSFDDSLKSMASSRSSLMSMHLTPTDADDDRASVRTTSSDASPISMDSKYLIKDSEGSSLGLKSDEFSSPYTPGTSAELFTPSPYKVSPGYDVSMLGMPECRGDASRMPIRRKEKTWLPCDVCGKKFDRPSLLKRHMRTHTGEKPHACDVCSKAFSTSSSLNTHRRIHSGEKPHQCQICGKCFTASSNLYYHRMTHKKEKPHKCTMCAKSFPTPGDLKSHMYVHNGSWPFKCDICNRGFSKQTNLRNHMLLHTGDKPHECQLCMKKFALQCNLRTHLKTHEEEPQDQCNKCGRTFLAGRQLVDRGVCRDCDVTSSLKPAGPRINNPFSIEALVAGAPRPRDIKSSSPHPFDASKHHHLAKAPYYASAMMSAGVLPVPQQSFTGGYGVGVTWPPTPLTHRFGI